ncbi:hypothetical protein OF83DRAFT_11438 [Amylostereum chailletii]|nr:hypothetical protein OF83DRAFT_11438 [Amylostereum chailletii]
MSDEDRAARAARAKALLNKKRQKKPLAAGANRADAASPTPSSPLARTQSPAFSEPQATDEDRSKADLGDLFTNSGPGESTSDAAWLSSLPRVGTPSVLSPPLTAPPSATPSPAPVHSPIPVQAKASHVPILSPSTSLSLPPGEELESLRSVIQSNQQTISFLVSEKASLGASLERLSDIETRAEQSEKLLQEERTTSQALRERVNALEEDARSTLSQITELTEKEKGLHDRCKEQERELQLTKGSVDEYKAEAEQSQRRVRELEEQIQSDDSVERLEASLQNVQDHATELELQLSKLKQAHAVLKTELDEADTQLRSRADSEAEWAAKCSDLEELHAQAQQEIASVRGVRDTLSQENAILQTQLQSAKHAASEYQEAVSRVTAEHIASMRQLQSVQADLRGATRRAEEAERIQRDLQAEGTSLMRSLEEMRPKIVELTDLKLELTENATALENALHERDSVIAHLESSLHELQDQHEQLEEQLRDALAARERDRASSQDAMDDLQRGYAELQTEIDEAHASIRDLEVDRTTQRQIVGRQTEQLDRMTQTSRMLTEELSSARHELEETKLAAMEQEDFLERARTDVEGLRADLIAKDEELEQLHAELSVLSTNPKSPSLDKEMLSALKQQHHLELSAAQSQIRALQTSLFEADARAHAFQKQISTLEDQLVQVRSSNASRVPPRPFSPDVPSRPPSRAKNHSDDLRRTSFNSRRSSGGHPTGPTQPAFGANLSPETRHKRKVSLGMLKARIDSEVAAVGSHPPSRAMTPMPLATVSEVHSAKGSSAPGSPLKRPQFLDESHIFWCHSCRGELVIL